MNNQMATGTYQLALLDLCQQNLESAVVVSGYPEVLLSMVMKLKGSVVFVVSAPGALSAKMLNQPLLDTDFPLINNTSVASRLRVPSGFDRKSVTYAEIPATPITFEPAVDIIFQEKQEVIPLFWGDA